MALFVPLSSASAAPVPPAMATAQQLGQSPFVMAAGETTGFAAAGDDQDETHLLLCTECSKNYEREASLVKAEAGAEGPRGSLPAWLVPDRPPVDQTPHHKVTETYQFLITGQCCSMIHRS